MVLFFSDRVVLLKSSEDPAKKICSYYQFEPLAAYFQLRLTQPPTKRVWSDLTCGFLQLAAGLLVENRMSSSRSGVGHKPDSNRPVNTPSNSAIMCYWCCFSIWQLDYGLSNSNNSGQKMYRTHYMVSIPNVNNPSIGIICPSINHLCRKNWVRKVHTCQLPILASSRLVTPGFSPEQHQQLLALIGIPSSPLTPPVQGKEVVNTSLLIF